MSWLITLDHQITANDKVAIREQQKLLLTDAIKEHEAPRRLHFDPDWQHDNPELLNPVRKLDSGLAGRTVSDFLSPGTTSGDPVIIQGSTALILLLDLFQFHFESRDAEEVSYQSHSYLPETDVLIAGEDSDSFITSLRMVNTRKQVLFGADIRWKYSWNR